MHERHIVLEEKAPVKEPAVSAGGRVAERSGYDFSAIDFSAPTVRRRLAAAYRVLLAQPSQRRLEAET